MTRHEIKDRLQAHLLYAEKLSADERSSIEAAMADELGLERAAQRTRKPKLKESLF